MARREYTHVIRCATEGCRESTVYVYETRRDEAEGYASQKKWPWQCYRHSKPDEVLGEDNRVSEVVLVREQRPGDLWLKDSFWLSEGRWNGLSSGPGFRAFAKDFPLGTRLIVTARIEYPEVSDAPVA